jgi:hypothetical protein
MCLLNITIEEIKLQLCPSLVVLSHKQGEGEKSDVSKKKRKKALRIMNTKAARTIEECLERFNYRI